MPPPRVLLNVLKYLFCSTVTQIFLLSVQHVSPIVVQAITLPCLKILSQFIKPKPATTKNNVVSLRICFVWCFVVWHVLSLILSSLGTLFEHLS